MSSIKRTRVRIPPLSDPRITLTPRIINDLRHALEEQNYAIESLIEHPQGDGFSDAITTLIKGSKKIIDLVPQIEDAIIFSVNSGWRYGAAQGVSEQNSKNAKKKYHSSKAAKEKFLTLWSTGKWKTKVSCIADNYEKVMREVGLWKDDEVSQKPDEQTFIRWLQSKK